MRKYIFILFIVPIVGFGQSKSFNNNQQYNQAMANAKLAFEAKQYSQAVMFYREAIKINPEALLPKYKIEDIRTIYIEKELKKEPDQISEKPKRKNKKEVETQKLIAKQQAEAEATRKMNEDADREAAELKRAYVEVVQINESSDDLDLNNSLQVQTVEKDQVAKLEIKATEISESEEDLKIDDKEEVPALETSEQAKLKIAATKIDESDEDLLIQDTDEVENIEEDRTTELQVRVVDIESTAEEIDDDFVVETVNQNDIPEVVAVKKKPEVRPVKRTYSEPAQPKQMTAEEKKVWIEKEKKRLAEVYPNKKTVEEIVKPGKHITRVIMNIDNKVTIYLKVKHSWGATFFFIDEIGQELRSINQQYFNLMTNLETYGG